MSPPWPIVLTDDYRKRARAAAVPDAVWDAGYKAHILPPTCDDHSARIALKLFPELIQHPQLVARAAVQSMRPIDAATTRWHTQFPRGRSEDDDPWQRVLGNMASR